MINEFNFETIECEWLDLKKMSVKYSTFLKYENVIFTQINPYFKNYQLNQFTDSNIIQFFMQKSRQEQLSNSYLKIIKYVLSSIIQFGRERFAFPTLHFNMIKFSQCNQTNQVLSSCEKEKLLQYCKNQYDCLSVSILISLYGGLRIGEICGLQWMNIDFENQLIYVEKTAQRQKNDNKNKKKKTHLVLTEPKTKTSKRCVPIPQFLINYLKTYKSSLNNEDFVLSNSFVICDPRTIQKKFSLLCQKNNIKTNFHNLRHSYATECVSENVEIKSLSEILGHSRVSTTLELYVHSSIDEKRKQINKLKTPQWS